MFVVVMSVIVMPHCRVRRCHVRHCHVRRCYRRLSLQLSYLAFRELYRIGEKGYKIVFRDCLFFVFKLQN